MLFIFVTHKLYFIVSTTSYSNKAATGGLILNYLKFGNDVTVCYFEIKQRNTRSNYSRRHIRIVSSILSILWPMLKNNYWLRQWSSLQIICGIFLDAA